jgi:hypothetical protein
VLVVDADALGDDDEAVVDEPEVLEDGVEELVADADDDEDAPLLVEDVDDEPVPVVSAPVSPLADWNWARFDGCNRVGVVATISCFVVRPSPYMLPWFVPLKPVYVHPTMFWLPPYTGSVRKPAQQSIQRS